ncbi:MAG: hypothetical protein NVSMB28_03670 [Collimonas sp.]
MERLGCLAAPKAGPAYIVVTIDAAIGNAAVASKWFDLNGVGKGDGTVTWTCSTQVTAS